MNPLEHIKSIIYINARLKRWVLSDYWMLYKIRVKLKGIVRRTAEFPRNSRSFLAYNPSRFAMLILCKDNINLNWAFDSC